MMIIFSVWEHIIICMGTITLHEPFNSMARRHVARATRVAHFGLNFTPRVTE